MGSTKVGGVRGQHADEDVRVWRRCSGLTNMFGSDEYVRVWRRCSGLTKMFGPDEERVTGDGQNCLTWSYVMWTVTVLFGWVI
jgi:hypothetical protein